MSTGVPFWKDESLNGAESIDDVVVAVGRECVNKIIMDHQAGQASLMYEFMQEKTGRNLTDAIDCFEFAMRDELADVAIRVGYALAMTNTGYGSFADCAGRAMLSSGLHGYKAYTTWLFYEERGEKPDRLPAA